MRRLLLTALSTAVLLATAGTARASTLDAQETDTTTQTFDLAAPAIDGRSVFVSQVGSGNDATVRQAASVARAELAQRGDDNTADVTQRDTGTTYLRAAQTGDVNRLGTVQAGTGASNLWVDQTGSSNRIAASQSTYGAIYNGGVLVQEGTGNDMALVQNGSDNRAALAQNGDDNRMTAVQNGTGNQLAWVQQGSGLSDLGVVQNGGQTLMITQTGGR